MFILLAKGSIAGPSYFMSLYMYQLILLEEYTQDRVVLFNMFFFHKPIWLGSSQAWFCI